MATFALMNHETTTQDHVQQQPIRRSSGRRKAKGGGDEKKNKQPRRGMGVAKLEERLREQGDITETDRPGIPLPFPEMNASSAYHLGPTWNPVGFQGFYGLMGSDRRLLQNHQFGNDSSFLVKNSDGNVVKCYSLNCISCHKKKKINGAGRPEIYRCGDRRFLGLDFGDNQNVLNQDHSPHNLRGPKPPQALGNNVNKVQVVAVHRKLGSSSNWDGGNNGVLMEYDFFPPSVKSGRTNEEGELVGVLGNSSVTGFDASNCVDLSLKLSY